MSHTRAPRKSLIQVAIGLGLLLSMMPICAQSASDAAVKAGFVYNFTKFTEWPADSFSTATAPLNLCVIGNQPLDGNLAMLHGRVAQGHPINVRGNPRQEELRACHLLYIGETEERRGAAVLAQVAASPVLTASDMEGFTDQGGIIGLALSGDRVQFTVNLRAARQAGLKLNAQMLRLGRVLQ